MTLKIDKRGRLKVPEMGKGGIREQVAETLRAEGWMVLDLNVIRTRAESGWWVSIGEKGRPDLLAMRPAGAATCRAVFVETKTKEGRLSADQIEWHATARREGFVVIVARDKDEAMAGVRMAISCCA